MTTTLAESGLSATGSRRLTLLLWGPFGGWKTVAAHTLPRTRTIDFDDGMQSVEWAIKSGVIKKSLNEIVYETILGDRDSVRGVVDMLNVACDQVDEWIAEEDLAQWDKPYPQHWDTLIIDSCSFMNDAAMRMGVRENHRIGMSKSWEEGRAGLDKKKLARGLWVTPMRQQDWGAASQLFQNAVAQWKKMGKNLVLIAHEYVNRDKDGIIKSYEPGFIGQLRSKIPAMMDDVWYSKIVTKGKTQENVFRTKPGGNRMLRSRLGCLDTEEPADFNKIRAKVAKFYGVPEDQLWRVYHGEEGRARAESESAREAVMI